ncbi:hypothetical protein [Halobacillus campisalis]|uniref:ABC transporter permease n=1 Tax=Halobacillus campisalis TaxID=435909 RepID=A0ABW2K0H8_9BACI|nr:hypothetical protein [Halobacillus campisalis]
MSFATWEVYRWVRKLRAKKKRSLYKQGFHLISDVTVLIYFAIFGVLFLFILADWMESFTPVVENWQGDLEEWMWILPFIVLIRACFQSFVYSGIPFTTSELKLTMLPHERSHLLSHLAMDRAVRQTTAIFAITLLIGGVTPLSYSFLFKVFLLYSLFLILSITVQWKLHSLNKWWKLLAVFGSAALLGALRNIYPEWNGWILSLILGSVLFGLNVYLIPRMMQNVDWDRVVEVNDARVWNVKFIGQLTKVDIKPPKRYGLLRTYMRSKRSKQRFKNIHQLYHRLWRHYLHHQFTYVWKTIAVCGVIIGVLPFQSEWILYVSVPIGIFVYIEMASSLFGDQFKEQPLLGVLPIEEKGWRDTFYSWALSGMAVLFLIFFLTVLVLNGFNLGVIFQLIGVIVWSTLDLRSRLIERMNDLQRKGFKHKEMLRLTGYVFLGACLYFPLAAAGIMLLIFTIYVGKLPFLRSML